jgi:hypothetical protein
VRNSKAFKKAQRAATLLVGHFVFDHRFVDLASVVPNTNEKAVTKFCQRARADYWGKYVRDVMPEEARAAIHLGLLRSIYSQNLNAGYLVRSVA